MGKFLYLTGEGLRSLWRAKLPMLGSTLTITLTLVLFGGATLVLSNFGRATKRLQSQYRIDVFFDPLYSNQEAFGVYQRVKAVDGISSTEFINKDRAASIFQQEFGEDVVAVLGTNPLPAGAVVIVARQNRTARRIHRIADTLAVLPGVTDVAYRGELVRILERYLQFAVGGGFVVGMVALLGAIFLVSNTIKLTIYARKEMIATLYLLGATRQFIRFPFLVAGMLQGLLGSLLALGIVVGLHDVVNYILEQFVLYRIISPRYLSAGLLTMGIGLGLLGTARSIRKFLSPRALAGA